MICSQRALLIKSAYRQVQPGDLYTTDDIEGAGLGTVERFQKGADAVLALTQGKIDCVVIDNQPCKILRCGK